ncbi:hypothetical protein DMB44_02155 [Thermoplasma sp. Kam2015]|uniref:DUF1641 domain-containing protein n=1 Tax=Thermoplasma sp. Kam2015 TaxID=2094122 RepID=UPI000D887155|nr:DUF1641 domain-containing protein [Thermoplasma sp. Kam2015]PYB68704.1 hypothetical protein DMB44_02155 [Thermoplasma sp. Kam2015]
MAKKIEEIDIQRMTDGSEIEEWLEDVGDLIKSLKTSGILDMMRALSEKRNDIIAILSKQASEERNRRFITNLLLIYSLLSSLDPSILETVTRGISYAINHSHEQRDRGSLSLIKINSMIKDPDVAAGLRTVLSIIGSLGKGGDTHGGE